MVLGKSPAKNTSGTRNEQVMMRIAFLSLLILHGVIHLMWFAHAMGWMDLSYFRKEIPGMVGASWLLAALFLFWSALQFGKRRSTWFRPALLGVLVSQMWIFSAWDNTKFGSFPNLVILIGILVGYAKWSFEERFREHVLSLLEDSEPSGELLTEDHLAPLPNAVREYIRKSGALGKPVVENFYLEFDGEMRQEGKPWFPFTSKQYNFIVHPGRLFFMKGRIKGLSVWGYHAYRPPSAKMVIRALSLFPQLKIDGPEMYPTESVTFLNDLCLFAPGALATTEIQWEELDASRVRATLILKDLEVSAVLQFDENGDLCDFRSEKRYEVSRRQWFPFSTPVKDFREFGGVRLPSYGEAVWHFPEGAFAYGKFRLRKVVYNLRELQS